MAITGALSIVTSALASGQMGRFTLVISNSGGSDVTATGIVPIVTANNAALAGTFGGPQKFGSTTWVVPAGSTLTVSWNGDFYAVPNALGTSTAYSVKAVIYTDDGVDPVSSTAVAVTVVPPAPLAAVLPVPFQCCFYLNTNVVLHVLGLP